jgi:hypothetical protein
MSSSTHTFAKTVNDQNGFVEYIRNTLTTPSDLRYDGTSVILTFTPALNGPNAALLSTLVANYVDPDARETLNDCNISPYNCTSTLLPAGGVYTGSWEEVSRYSSLTVCMRASVASANQGVQLQFGVLSQTPDSVNLYNYYSPGVSQTFAVPASGKFFRVVYTNDPTTAQTSFALCTFWSVSATVPLWQLTKGIIDQSDALLTRSVLTARGDNVQYSNCRVDEANQLRVRLPTNYERVVTATSVAIIQLSFNYNVNTDETNSLLAGSGTITYNAGRAQMNCGAAANSYAALSSQRYCRCAAGNKLTVMMGAAFSTPANGNSQLAGGGTATNGLFFGYVNTAFGVVVRSNSVDLFTATTAFNVDKLDGTGPSGITLNPLFGNTFVFMFDASGFGTVSFYITAPLGTSRQLMPDLLLVHRMSFANNSVGVGLLNPQFPCAAYSLNTTNTTSKTVSIASFSAFIDGPPRRTLLLRTVDYYKTINSTTYVPHFAIQNKAVFNGVNNSTTVHLRELCSAASGGTKNIYHIMM